MQLDEYVTTVEAAGQTGLTVGYLTRLLREHKIQGRQIRRVWFIEKASLAAYMASNRKPGPKRQPAQSHV